MEGRVRDRLGPFYGRVVVEFRPFFSPMHAPHEGGLAVVAEAGLSYVGLGVQPPLPSWGRMLAEAQTMIGFAPWIAIFPGLAIMILVFGFGLIGDGLNDHLNPRLRKER